MKLIGINILVLFLLSIASCQVNNEKKLETNSNDSLIINQEKAKAFDLMSTKCFACHGADASLQNRIAPPMIAIKKHYIKEETTLETFTQDMVSFVQDPTVEHVKMKGAFKRFGLMPKLDFPEAELKLIAKYIYENEIDEPTWFKKHLEGNQKQQSNIETEISLTPLEKGLKLALSSKKVLGKNLMSAINQQGSAYAVKFCNIKANHLIDSMSNALNAKIKRVSDKPRNANANANPRELEIIQKYKKMILNGEEIATVIDETENTHIGYYPIMTNQMCLQCHGIKTKHINEETSNRISKLYPKDKATGYDINELRGIWVVAMTK